MLKGLIIECCTQVFSQYNGVYRSKLGDLYRGGGWWGVRIFGLLCNWLFETLFKT